MSPHSIRAPPQQLLEPPRRRRDEAAEPGVLIGQARLETTILAEKYHGPSLTRSTIRPRRQEKEIPKVWQLKTKAIRR